MASVEMTYILAVPLRGRVALCDGRDVSGRVLSVFSSVAERLLSAY